MDTTANKLPTVFGTPFEGGFFTGKFIMDGLMFALITAGNVEGEHKPVVWNKSLKRVSGAESFVDGFTNTEAMADAGSVLAQWARSLRIGSFDDWYIPSRDEKEIQYRVFKPSTTKNWVYRNGDNPSSYPPGYPYTENSPIQTIAEAFRSGGAEAFEQDWYWTSTQYASASGFAWVQGFDNGDQGSDHEDTKFLARAVRRLVIEN